MVMSDPFRETDENLPSTPNGEHTIVGDPYRSVASDKGTILATGVTNDNKSPLEDTK